jgi:hypothetical protein
MGIRKDKWQQHLQAAQASGMSLSGYAALNGIRVQSLYDARSRAKAKAKSTSKTKAFVQIKLKPHLTVGVVPNATEPKAVPTLAMQARLGNGVVLSWTHEAGNGPAVADLMHILTGLPCFA